MRPLRERRRLGWRRLWWDRPGEVVLGIDSLFVYMVRAIWLKESGPSLLVKLTLALAGAAAIVWVCSGLSPLRPEIV
jgi:hypothetical protein